MSAKVHVMAPGQESMKAVAGIHVEESMFLDFQDGAGKQNFVMSHVSLDKVVKMICCPSCCLFVPLAGKNFEIEYQRQCGICSCPYSVHKNNSYSGKVKDVGCCDNGCWFCFCPFLTCSGHLKLMSMVDREDNEKIVFTKELFPCWPCVQGCAVGCAPLGMCLLSMSGCCNYCSGTEFLTIQQPVYAGAWTRSSGVDPEKIGELTQSYRFTPVGCCTAVPTPLKFYFKPTTPKGAKIAAEHIELISLTLALYRGLPSPCKMCSPLTFQVPTGVYCLDCGLNTTQRWNTVTDIMRESD